MDYKQDVCWKCGLSGIDYDSDMYCRHCGTLLINYCPNEDCEDDGSLRSLDSNDLFCPFCGHASKFAELGYFSSAE